MKIGENQENFLKKGNAWTTIEDKSSLALVRHGW